MSPGSLQEFKAELFGALAHPTRIRLVELLAPGEMSVSELQQRLNIEMGSVSQQLGVLRRYEVVSTRREGTSVYYRLRDAKVTELLAVARALFDSRLAELQALRGQEGPGPSINDALSGGPRV